MCLYCMVADWNFRMHPPWNPHDPITPWPSTVPFPVQPQAPIVPWDVQKLVEFRDLLRRVKDLEDNLGCPCEPNKADYLDLLRKRIEHLEAEANKKGIEK